MKKHWLLYFLAMCMVGVGYCSKGMDFASIKENLSDSMESEFLLEAPDDLSQYDSRYSDRPTFSETKPWVVFADRDSIPLFKDENCQRPMGRFRIGLMDRFFVTKVSSDRNALKLAHAELKKPVKNSVLTEIFGWAKIEHLLLANSCGKSRGIYNKVFVSDSWPIGCADKRGDFRLYDRPGQNGKILTCKLKPFFGYLYKTVWSENGDRWYMIGNCRSFFELGMNGDQNDGVHYTFGWVKSPHARLWTSDESLTIDSANIDGSPSRHRKRNKDLCDAERIIVLSKESSYPKKNAMLFQLPELLADCGNLHHAPSRLGFSKPTIPFSFSNTSFPCGKSYQKERLIDRDRIGKLIDTWKDLKDSNSTEIQQALSKFQRIRNSPGMWFHNLGTQYTWIPDSYFPANSH